MTYRTGQIFVAGFHGTIRGQGMDTTIVEALPGYVVTQDNGPLGAFTHEPGPDNPYPAMITLWSAVDVGVEDLTMRVTAYEPTTGWYYGQDYFVTWLKAAIIVQGGAAFARAAFEGAAGTDDVVNLDNGPMVMNASGVTVTLTACRTSRVGNGFEVAFVDHADIVVGGAEADGNRFEDNSGGGLFYAVDASTIEYSHNHVASAIAGWNGVTFNNDLDFTPTGVTRVRMSHDRIAVAGESLAGIYLFDLGSLFGAPTLNVSIVRERIELDDAPLAAGVRAVAMSGGHIADSRIRGAGRVGLLMNFVDGCLLESNDVSKLTARTAPIWLRPASHDCTAVVDDADDVLDQGVRNTVVVAAHGP